MLLNSAVVRSEVASREREDHSKCTLDLSGNIDTRELVDEVCDDRGDCGGSGCANNFGANAARGRDVGIDLAHNTILSLLAGLAGDKLGGIGGAVEAIDDIKIVVH